MSLSLTDGRDAGLDISHFDAANQKWYQDFRATSDKAFVMHSMVIAKGTPQEKTIFWMDPVEKKNEVPFLELPPEIRNMIYGYVLSSELPIRARQIRRRAKDDIFESFFSFRRGGESAMVKPEEWYRNNDAPIKSPAFLRICKHITSEILPMLYGRDVFIFPSTSALMDFGFDINNNMRYVRNVKFDLGSLVKSTRKVAFELLSEASKLKTLTFHWDEVASGILDLTDNEYHEMLLNITKFVRVILPVLKNLHEDRKNTPEGSDVLEIVRFDGTECFNCTHKNARNKKSWICRMSHFTAKEISDYNESLRALLNDRIAYELGIKREWTAISGRGICPPGVQQLGFPETGVRREVFPDEGGVESDGDSEIKVEDMDEY